MLTFIGRDSRPRGRTRRLALATAMAGVVWLLPTTSSPAFAASASGGTSAARGAATWAPALVPVSVRATAPRRVRVTATTSSSVSLSWTAPRRASTQRQRVLRYRVQVSRGARSGVVSVRPIGRRQGAITVTGLPEGVRHRFRVRARTAGGWGAWSARVSATPMDQPSIPTTGDQRPTDPVSPAPAALDTVGVPSQGSPGPTEAPTWESANPPLPGPSTSPSPTPSSPAPTAEQPPAAFAVASVTESDRRLDVTWSASTGASGYRVAVSPGAATVTVTGTSATITNLVNGQSYTVTVTAWNGVGEVAATASGSPFTRASVPGRLRVAHSSVAAFLAWNAPADDGGREITDYVVSIRQVGVAGGPIVRTVPASQRWLVVSGLPVGTIQSISVAATTAAGAGQAAVDLEELTTAPDPPTTLSASWSGTGQLSLSWTPAPLPAQVDSYAGWHIRLYAADPSTSGALEILPSPSLPGLPVCEPDSRTSAVLDLTGYDLPDRIWVTLQPIGRNQACDELYPGPEGPWPGGTAVDVR